MYNIHNFIYTHLYTHTRIHIHSYAFRPHAEAHTKRQFDIRAAIKSVRQNDWRETNWSHSGESFSRCLKRALYHRSRHLGWLTGAFCLIYYTRYCGLVSYRHTHSHGIFSANNTVLTKKAHIVQRNVNMKRIITLYIPLSTSTVYIHTLHVRIMYSLCISHSHTRTQTPMLWSLCICVCDYKRAK